MGFDRDATPNERAAANELQHSERFALTLARLRHRLEDPEVRERIERERQRRAAEREAELRARCDALGIPEAERVREAVLAEQALETQAMRALAPLGPRTLHVTRTGNMRPGILMLVGEPGQGKTVAMARAVLHHPRSARLVAASAIADPKVGGFDGRAVREAWDRLVRVDLLAIDELGWEAQPQLLVELLLRRFDAGRFTVCASNLDPKTFAERYREQALFDRVASQGFRADVLLTGPSLRRGAP